MYMDEQVISQTLDLLSSDSVALFIFVACNLFLLISISFFFNQKLMMTLYNIE